MKAERELAGLRCSEVLERLSDYVDGALPGDARARIEEHVKGCDLCERFGGRFGSVVRALRERLAEAEPLSEDMAARLMQRLEAQLDE